MRKAYHDCLDIGNFAYTRAGLSPRKRWSALPMTGSLYSAIIRSVRSGERERSGMEAALKILHGGQHNAEKTGDAVELPQAVEALLAARTADAVFVVDPEYRIVHWDARAELDGPSVGRGNRQALLRGGLRQVRGWRSFCARECSAMRMARAGQASPGYDMRIFTRSSGKRWVNVKHPQRGRRGGTLPGASSQGRAGSARDPGDGARSAPADLREGKFPRRRFPTRGTFRR